ncbi:mannose/fructose/sorbose PTS transporter subunit IIB [Mammaliicoccus lentus]|uniref:mannose/fructose/sorbose PTS transporter subunit IIB n=1 Tax=Mammaliicoccus lentus TaxID=42858 RepID=UPI003F57DCD3
MIIKLIRIDDRLIHGQVTTVWTKEAQAERLIICDDQVAEDKIRTNLLKQSAPPGIKVSVVDTDKAVRVLKNPKYERDTAFLLFTNPRSILDIVEQGIEIEHINIGGMSYKKNKKQITKAVSVDEEDIKAFKELNKLNIDLDYRVIKTDPKVDFINLLDKAMQS